MMHRNLDRRVEALVQLTGGADTSYVLDLLDRYMDPETASWHLDNQGVWTRHHLAEGDGRSLDDVQSWLLASRSRQRSTSLR
jgi:polyphosphate kinase